MSAQATSLSPHHNMHTGLYDVGQFSCDTIQRVLTNVCLGDATMSGLAELLPVTARVSRVSLAATFAAWLVLGPSAMGVAADDERPEQAPAAEQRLLGSDDEAARFAACQPFTREIAAAGAVEESFDASLTDAGVPAAARLEVRRCPRRFHRPWPRGGCR